MVSLDSRLDWKSFCYQSWVCNNPALAACDALFPENKLSIILKQIAPEEYQIFAETLNILIRLSNDAEILQCATYCLLAQEPHDPQLPASRREQCPELDKMIEQYFYLEDILRRAHSSLGVHKEHIRKMLLATVDDPRLVVIMLCKVLALMRLQQGANQAYWLYLSQLALEIFAPLAHRLGIGQLKWEIEDLAFYKLHPEDYLLLRQKLAQSKIQRDNFINEVQSYVKELLQKEQIVAEVMGRTKHFYSIWKKMSHKNKTFDEIYDLNAIRILVTSVQDCYRILGLIHTQWRYLPQQFNDYIANPKVNGYSSLHTAVVIDQKIVEVQIRTYQMHDDAELGIAAHWMYKDSGGQQKKSYHKKLQTLRYLLEHDHHYSSELFESVKEEVFLDRIYVFTPKGDLYDLPKGATALDFAYHIHTELGHHCCGARTQGKMLALTEPLINGMVVEIFKAERSQPSRDWLNLHYGYIKTARARQKVAHWFRSLDKARHTHEGKNYFEKNMKRLALPYQGSALEGLLSQLHFKNKDELYHALSTGDMRLSKVIDVLDPLKKKECLKSAPPAQTPPQSGPIIFHELGDKVQYYLAPCCDPSPPQPIVGLITRGRGIGIHCRQCSNLLGISQWYHRILFAHWPDQRPLEGQLMAHVEIHVQQWEAFGQVVLPLLLQQGAYFDELPQQSQWRAGYPYATLTLTVESRHKLSLIEEQLLQQPLVHQVNILSTTLPKDSMG